MADDNNKKPKTQEEIHEQNRKSLRAYWGVAPLESLKKRGIKDVDTPIRPGASADSSGYFAKAWHAAKKERSDWHNNRKGYTMPEIEKMEAKSGDVMNYFHEKVDKAKDDYHRQKDKMDKSGIIKYDKDGHPISLFSSKKEMKPAAIVSPVKRPSEAVMKKLTGKK
jgi:hypothetical protein